MSYFGNTDYFLEVAKGNVPGSTSGIIVGVSQHIQTGKTQTIWDVDVNYEYLTADTQLYISSSDALDTAVTVLVQGLDENYLEVSRTVTVNGQSQVALSDLMFRVHLAVVTSAITPLGDLYVAVSTALTLGVPNALADIKAKIPLATDSLGVPIDTGTDYASDNISHNGIYTVPAGKTLYALYLPIIVAKNEDIEFNGRIRQQGGAWLNRNPVPLYQNAFGQEFRNRLQILEKTDFEARARSGSDDTETQFQLQFILVDN